MMVLQLRGPMAFCVLQWCHPVLASDKEDKLLYPDDHLIWCSKVDSGPCTTYEELMMSAKEAEAEWIDNKALVKSTVVNEDPGKKEREELKQRIEKLTESVKAANLQTKPASP